MDGYGGLERRQHLRFDCRFQVSFKPKDAQAEYDYSQTRNISQGGILLTASECFGKGTLLEMIMRIPFTPSALKLSGEVVWLKKIPNALVYEMGIKFLEQDPILNKFISERLH